MALSIDCVVGGANGDSVTAELVLRASGYGYPTSFFVESPGPKEGEVVYASNVNFGLRFFPPELIRRPAIVSMSKVKQPGSYRVFVLGESAAMGFPDPSTSFARILEVMLREAYPEIKFEIINTAMTAINSNVIRAIAIECAQYQPDLFIVHIGNNEVVGPFGAAGVLGYYSPSLTGIRASLWVKQTRIGQLLGNNLHASASNDGPRSWEGMSIFHRSHVSADDPRLNQLLMNFRGNLRDICTAGTNSGADVIVCTIPTNVRDSAPFASQHRSDLLPERWAEWEAIYKEGISLEAAGKVSEAIALFERASEIDDCFADLHFRLARCYTTLGNNPLAKRRFLQALSPTLRSLILIWPTFWPLKEGLKKPQPYSRTGSTRSQTVRRHLRISRTF
jgi:hypothetical protein